MFSESVFPGNHALFSINSNYIVEAYTEFTYHYQAVYHVKLLHTAYHRLVHAPVMIAYRGAAARTHTRSLASSSSAASSPSVMRGSRNAFSSS